MTFARLEALLLTNIKIARDTIPQIAKPMNMGNTDFWIKLPTNAAMGMDNKVEIKPVIAAPIPAICPIGSMAMERKFPHIKPKQKNCKERNPINIATSGFPEFQNNSTYINATLLNMESAVKESLRIPNFNTRVPFKKVDKPMDTDKPAKINGKASFSP